MSAEDNYYLELLKKDLEGTLTSEEREELDMLAKADPDKKCLLEYLHNTKEEREARLEAEIIYEKTLPNDLRPIISLTKPTDSIRPKRSIYRYIAVVAACLICVVGGMWSIHYRQLPMEDNEWEIMATEKGERKFFRMNDGTEIWLNSESVLKVKSGYGKVHRIMSLEGEAYFSVAKNEKLPLHVHALDAEIEVLGTVFNVRAYPEEKKIATSLVEGKVKLHVDGKAGKRDYNLNPGDKVEVANTHFVALGQTQRLEKTVTKTEIVEDIVDYKKIAVANEEALELLWIENKLVFNGDPLETIVKKMERWYNRTIVIENDKLRNEPFSGVFQERTAEQVLDILRITGVKFNYKVDNDIIYIK